MTEHPFKKSVHGKALNGTTVYNVKIISCGCCGRAFFISMKDFEKYERQWLNIYCPFTRKIAFKQPTIKERILKEMVK